MTNPTVVNSTEQRLNGCHAGLPVCLWKENPYRLVSLLDMLNFAAHRYLVVGEYLYRTSSLLSFPILPFEPFEIPDERPRHEKDLLLKRNEELAKYQQEQNEFRSALLREITEQLPPLQEECAKLGMRSSVAQIKRIRAGEFTAGKLSDALRELSTRIHDDLEGQGFFALETSEQQFYAEPFAGWEKAIERFPQLQDDIEEAGKCYAFGRYGATIYHLMRITEAGVIALGKLTDPNDYKPQFGSVLKKLDELVKNTKWKDWPEDAKPHRSFFEEILPRLHAVKGSWRDKASHFDNHIIPTDAVFTRERALDIYNSTQSLIRLIAERVVRTF